MTILKPVTLTLLLASGMVSQAQAARIIDEANHKAVNQVHWHKVDNIAAKDRLNQAIPDNTASVVFYANLTKTDYKPAPTSPSTTVFKSAYSPTTTAKSIPAWAATKSALKSLGTKTTTCSKTPTSTNSAPTPPTFLK